MAVIFYSDVTIVARMDFCSDRWSFRPVSIKEDIKEGLREVKEIEGDFT